MELISRFAGAPCPGGNFFGFPTWYKYLPSLDGSNPCTPQLGSIADVWLIVAAIIEILLRVAALVAVAFVVYGGVLYIASQGQPEQTSQARKTILNAVIGLVIAIGATAVVSFVAGRFN